MIGRLRYEEAARDQAEAARRDLVAAVSHDLRTPITSLRLLAEAVDDDIVDGEDAPRLPATRMRTHIDALSALIDDLFELSRLEAGDIRWSLEQVPLDELVGETVEAMRVQAEAKGVAVARRACRTRSLPARANPEKLQRVLFNLIQNAIRHTPADGSVDRARGAGRRRGSRSRSPTPATGSRPSSATRVFERVLSRRATRRRTSAGRRARARGLARDRRGPRRARSGSADATVRHARALQPADGDKDHRVAAVSSRLDRGVSPAWTAASAAWTAASAPGGPRRQLHLDPGGRVVADHPVKPPSA